MDMSSGASPLAGFDEVEGLAEYGVVVNRTREVGAGPSGQDVYRFTFLHDASQMNSGSAYGGEHYLGWTVDVGSTPASGDSRFGRLRFKVSADSNLLAINSSSGADAQIIHKIVIVADGGAARTIISLHGDGLGGFTMQVGKNGEGNIHVDGLSVGTDYDLQWETRLHTSGSAYLKVWINNNTYASPTGTATGLTMSPASYNLFSVGFYNNRMLASDGVYVIDLCDAEYGTAFDATWSS